MKSKTFKGAIDNVELGNLTGLLAKIKPAVKATSFKGERASKNAAFVDDGRLLGVIRRCIARPPRLSKLLTNSARALFNFS